MTEPEQRPQAPLDTERVRAHARRVLDSESFSKAHSLRRFLAYVVDETLAGRADTLKEYAIGVEVFGRGEAFDPRADTIVRVQARRLRSKLEQYYAAAGHAGRHRHRRADRQLPAALPRGAGRRRRQTPRPRRTATGRGRRAAGRAPRPRAPLPVPRTTLIGRDAEVAAILGALRGGGSPRADAGRARRQRQDAAGAAGRGRRRRRLSRAASRSSASARWPTPPTSRRRWRRRSGCRASNAARSTTRCAAHVRATIRERTLLVLDNFEQLLAAAPLLVDLLESTTALTLLVTSRAVLHVSGEQCIPVPPLPVPDLARLPPLDALARNPAVALFVRQARGAAAGLRADRRQRRRRRRDLRAASTGCRWPSSWRRRGSRILSPAQMLGAPRAPAGPAHRRRPRPARAAADAAPGDRLEPRPADRRREAPVPPARGVRRRLHARRPPRRCAIRARTPACRSSTGCRRSSTRACCRRSTRRRTSRASRCSRPCASTRWSSSTRAASIR